MTKTNFYFKVGLASLLLAAFTNSSRAQLTLNSVGFRLGTIEAYSTNKMVFYPEIQTGGQFFLQYLEWTAYYAHWDDAVTQVNTTENAVYSIRGNILGARIALNPSKLDEHWSLPITVFGGIAHQFISPTYVGGSNQISGTEYLGSNAINSFEFGVSAFARIFDAVELHAQVQQLFAISEVSKRLSCSAGVNYVF
jgi:hypothetical protein